MRPSLTDWMMGNDSELRPLAAQQRTTVEIRLLHQCAPRLVQMLPPALQNGLALVGPAIRPIAEGACRQLLNLIGRQFSNGDFDSWVEWGPNEIAL